MSFRGSIKQVREKLQNWVLPSATKRPVERGSYRMTEQQQRRAVVVAPASPGSVGDEAMMSALTEQLRLRGVEQITVATWREEDRWEMAGGPVAHEVLPLGNLAGSPKFNQALRSAASLYLIGADVIDGIYGAEHSLHMLAVAQYGAQCGLRSTIVGCSFSDSPQPPVVEYLKQLDSRVAVLARDCYSQRRLERAMQRKIPLVADIAFLLKPDQESGAALQVLEWIARQRQAVRGPVIGCNLNAQPLSKGGGEPAALLAAYVETLRHWWKTFSGELSIVIVPHDHRREHRELEICETFRQMLPAEIQTRVLLVRDPLSAAGVKAIMGHCDMVLTGRMHLAVAALGSGKPAVCLGYNSKFEGLLAAFGLEELVLDWRQAIMPGQLAVWSGNIVARRAELSAQVAAKLPGVMELSRANLYLGRAPGFEKPESSDGPGAQGHDAAGNNRQLVS
ncbi:MAG: hypothetical protein JWR19_3539 [Pedosphaera sp.]|nr:hypothetical protein [Pedosphaera sp.]